MSDQGVTKRKMVPVEPTKEMCLAAANTTHLQHYKKLCEEEGQRILGTEKPVPAPAHASMAAYVALKAAIQAAPTPPPLPTEADANDAPPGWNNSEAAAWASGFNACLTLLQWGR